MTRTAPFAILLTALALAVSPVGSGPATAQVQQAVPPAAAPADRQPAETGSIPDSERLAPAQQGQQVAPQAPDQQGPGCSYRNNKLDLLV